MTQAVRIYVVDDDQAVLRSLSGLLTANGFETTAFSSAEDFLNRFDDNNRACLLLDLRMPGMTGLELQSELNRQGCKIPVIMLTGHGDVPAAVRAMKFGAIDFLEKPSSEERLLDAIESARLYLNDAPAQAAVPAGVVARRLSRLTSREREILQHLILGMSNKEIATTLGISPRTVEIHRARIREKMEAGGLSDLIRMMHR